MDTNEIAKPKIYEFTIMTNDGWAVTLVTDEAVDHCLGEVGISSVIVQPIEDYNKRVVAEYIVRSTTKLSAAERRLEVM